MQSPEQRHLLASVSVVDDSEELLAIPPGVSPSIERMLSRPRPRWRGRIHRVAVPCSVATALIVAFNVPAGQDRIGALVYGAGATLMLVASSIVHFKKWPIPVWEKLFRFDHAAIFILIGAGATPIAISALDGRSTTLMLLAVWIGAGIGVVMRLLPFHPPKGLMNTLYIALGWVPIVVAPEIFQSLSGTALALLIAEGVLYCGGALMLGARWPDPSPKVFGYHEVWHVSVTTAVWLHYVLILLIANP